MESRMHKIRGQLVLLDLNVAELYNIETKYLNRAVKRNKHLFFNKGFQLTDEESKVFLNSNPQGKARGGSRYNPHVFTQEGAKIVKFCLNPENSNSPTYPLKDILINEKVLEEYIKTFPLDFLGENGLLINSQQEVLGGLRPDLSFQSGKGLLVSEIQLGNLDRYHLYKSLEYRDLFKIKYKTDKVRVVVFCNGLHDDYLQILRIHKVEIVHKDSDWIYDKMKQVDGFKIQKELLNKHPIPKSLDSIDNKIEEIFSKSKIVSI